MPRFVRNYIGELSHEINKSVALGAWIGAKRDHGKVLFLDLCI